MKTPDPNDPFEKLLKECPDVGVREKLRAAKDALDFQNPDDPIFQLMRVLGTWAVYYKTIPELITKEVEKVIAENEKAEKSLNLRVREVVGAAHLLQRAHDEIEKTVPAEVAKNVAARVNAAIAQLPLASFTETISQASTAARIAASTADESSKKVKAAVDTIDGYADQLRNLPGPFWRNVGFALLGAAITAAVGWWFVVRPMEKERPDMKYVAQAYYNESFIGKRAVAGFIDDQPVIVIGKDDWESHREDPQTGRLTVFLKK